MERGSGKTWNFNGLRVFAIWTVFGFSVLIGLNSINKSIKHSMVTTGVLHKGNSPEEAMLPSTMTSGRFLRKNSALLGASMGNKDDSEKLDALSILNRTVSEISWGQSLRFLWSHLVQQTTKPGTTNHMIVSNLISRHAGNNISTMEDIVLVTHGSVVKLDNFLTQLQYWKGPASLTLYVTDGGEQIDKLEHFVQEHQHHLYNTSIHIYMEYTNPSGQNSEPLLYPHNILRNLAMDECGSDFFVALDVDFVPGPEDCYSSLQETTRANNGRILRQLKEGQKVYVLPAFEMFAPEGEERATPERLPSNKDELYHQVHQNLSEPFHQTRYEPGHGPTNFEEWFSYRNGDSISENDNNNNATSYLISFRPGFEPYILAYRPGIPHYWNGYRGFGLNKVSWFMEIHRAGYSMNVLTQQYVIHLEHPSTYNLEQQYTNMETHDAFLKYLDNKYPLVKNRQKNDTRYFHDFRKIAEAKKAKAKKKNAKWNSKNQTIVKLPTNDTSVNTLLPQESSRTSLSGDSKDELDSHNHTIVELSVNNTSVTTLLSE